MGNIRGWLGGWFVVWSGLWILAAGALCVDVPAESDALVMRVVHPDRQAAAFLKLFEGSRAAHPAAALAAWKRATRDPLQLGKTLEALIALANPEMVPEWRIFHQAELRMNLRPSDATPCWNFVAPHDDGTAATMVTAFRLSDQEDPPLLDEHGQDHVVTRFSKTGSVVMSHVGTTFLLAASRDELARAIRQLPRGTTVTDLRLTTTASQSEGDLELRRLASRIDSGLVFDLRPRQIVPPSGGSLVMRRAVELLHAIGCRQMNGTLALENERLSLDLTTQLDVADRADGGAPRAVVEPGWLELIPTRNLIGVVSLAVESSPRFWDRLFALADRLERVDPARRDVAPLRTRFNLLAATAGVRPEADLWPRLRGLTAYAVGDSRTPRRISGSILVLHADSASSAERLAGEFVPRFSALAIGKHTAVPKPDAAKVTRPASDAVRRENASSVLRRLGTVGGRTLAVCQKDRNVLIGWGDESLIELLEFSGTPVDSAAGFCACWARENKKAPRRIGALWPARLAAVLSRAAATAPAVRAMADDPPLVWWGWTETTQEHDVVFWTDLRRRVQNLLSELPLDTPPYR